MPIANAVYSRLLPSGRRTAVRWFAGAGIGCLYVLCFLWIFDGAFWLLSKFAAGRLERRVRYGIAAAVLVAFFAGAVASAPPSKATPAASPASVAAASVAAAPSTGAGISAAPSAGPSASPSAADTATPSAAATPSGAASVSPSDDEAGQTAGPSFDPAATGVPAPPVTTVGDRLPGEPDPILTPGALNPSVTQATIGSTICVSGWTDSIRPDTSYTNELKLTQMAQYGYSDTSPADYEEDHLISLELGGAPADPRNLWPEPYTASLSDGRPSGARTKDVLETRLKTGVCAGAITLAEAQSEIGDHWVHAFYGIPLATTPTPTAPAPTPSSRPSAAPTLPPVATPPPAGTPAPVTFEVTITSLPSVGHGAYDTMTVSTSAGASCSASVKYPSGAMAKAQGMPATHTADAAGHVSWTWKVGTRTGAGTATGYATCTYEGISKSASRTFAIL